MLRKNVIKVHKGSFKQVKEEFQSMPNRSVCLVLYEEEIYIDNIVIPAAKGKWIEGIIQNNMIYNFEEIDKLSYSYEISKLKNGMLNVRIFCINSESSELFHHVVGKGRVTSVYLIQFCYVCYSFKKLRIAKYILIFSSHDYTYLLLCNKATLIKSYVFESSRATFSKINSLIESLLADKNLGGSYERVPVLFINFEFRDIIERLSYKYAIYDLARRDESKIIKKYIGGI